MAIKINFDLANNPETPTLILATRDGNKLGQLEAKQIELSEKLIGASEITFIVNKYVDGRLTNLWDRIVDFKLVYCKEWDVWFEIRVEIDEDTKTVKTVFGTQLGQAELSQLMLYNIEINTEADIARDDYKISVLYDPDDHDASILHRLFDKAPHYSFGHVDGTLYHIQRSFSFDETSIYDALQEIAEEVGCLFVFHSGMTDDGGIERYIEVWDLEQYCNNPNCKHRGEFTEVCPKCGGTNIDYGYGEDTNIFITADELASNNIQFTTDTDSVKNCFKLEAGDDLMTATIRNCNPNGTDYIWYFSDSIKEDMSEDLKNRLTAYDALYLDYQKNHSFSLDSNLLGKYNSIVNKYKTYNDALENIPSSITGYSQLMNAYYNMVDLSLYLESGMMPTVAMSSTTAANEATRLKNDFPTSIAVANIDSVSEPTAKSVALGMAKIFVKPTYKVEVKSSSLSGKTWSGTFTITNYSDEEDTATTSTITATVNGNAELFTKQKIEKALNQSDAEDYSVTGVFKKNVHSVDNGNCSCAFCSELKKYALNPLNSFRDACQACIDILIEQGVASSNPTENLYKNLYLPYWNRLKAIEKEIKTRADDIAAIDGVYDEEGNLTKKGLASDIEKIKQDVQNALDFELFLVEGDGDDSDVLTEFSSYRREDKYKNENYISDGLNNAELFDRALEFIETAENEIFKSAELQHSISSSLKNLMAIKKFKSLVDYFEVGNWMRIQIDDVIYKLRLLEYTIDFDNLEDIPVVFSDVSKVRNGITDLEDIFSQASSMTTHYEGVKRQASKGQEAQGTIEQWLEKGLNSALVRINSNNSEEVSLTQNGILCRSYDALTDSYSNEQLKLTHNIMAYTHDDWKTVKQAIGKHDYVVYDNDEKSSTYDKWIPQTGYGMSAEFVTSGYLIGSTIVGGEIYSANYSNGKGGSATPVGTYINLQTGEFSFGGEKIVYDKDEDTITLNNVTIQWSDGSEGSSGVNPPDASNIGGLEAYLNQLDGMIGTYSQENDPSTSWTDEQKADKVGDLWFNPKTGLTKRWNGSSWDTITDKDLEELAQSKARIFTSQPVPPYNVGDLWVQGSAGDIWHCETARATGGFVADDWVKSSKYTNDDTVKEFINGDYKTNLNDINSQLDKKAETWYQPTDPSTAWDTDTSKKQHVGDLWHYTGDTNAVTVNGEGISKDSEWIWQYNSKDNTYQWCKMEVPDEVFDAIDGKSTIYTSAPSSQEVGDLLIPAETFVNGTYTFYEKRIYRCTTTDTYFNPAQWIEVDYANQSDFDAFLEQYASDLEDIRNQSDQSATTWVTSTDPSTSWTDDTLKAQHVGDIWRNTKGTSNASDDEDFIYTRVNNGNNITYEWVKSAVDIPDEVFDLLDGKATIYVSLPPTGVIPNTGDLLIPTSDISTNYKRGKVYKWTGSAWSEINYTDDTAVNEVKGGIQFTKINDKYVISPHIVGGDLKIQQGDTYSAEITNEGKLIATGAEIQGDFKSGLKTGGYNFQATNGVINLGVQSDGSYAMTVGSNGKITFGAGVTLSWNSITDKPNIPDSSGGNPSGGTSSNIDQTLRTALGYGTTMIDGQYVISPYIYGGHLYIGDTNKTQYAEIASSGILTAEGAVIRGKGTFSNGLYGQLIEKYNSADKYNFVVENNCVYAGWDKTNKRYNFQIDSNGNVTIIGTITVSGGGSGGSDGNDSVDWNDIQNKPTILDENQVTTITNTAISTATISANQITAGTLQSANGNTYFDLTNNQFVSKGTDANWALKDGVMTFTNSDDNWLSAVQISTDAMGMLWLTKTPKKNGILQSIVSANGLALHNYGSLKTGERSGSGYGIADSITSGYETSVIKFFTKLNDQGDYDTMIDRLMVRTQDVVCKKLTADSISNIKKIVGIQSGKQTASYTSDPSFGDDNYVDMTVTFTDSFSAAPHVVVTPIKSNATPGKHLFIVTSVTSTNFVVRYMRTVKGAATCDFSWIAIGSIASS